MERKPQPAEAVDEEVEIDIDSMSPTVVEDQPSVVEAPPAAEDKKPGVIAALEGATGDLHAIQVRLAEIVPFLLGAIEEADGHVKDFLHLLVDSL
jgi:hypothetical protein